MLGASTTFTTVVYLQSMNIKKIIQTLQTEINQINLKLDADDLLCEHSAAINSSYIPSECRRIRATDNSTACTYFNMNFPCKGITGGWRRIAYLNQSDPSSTHCPGQLTARPDPPSCIHGESTPGCSEVIYINRGPPYAHICGKINAIQSGSPDGFQSFSEHSPPPTIEENYVDGVSLTYGTNPRKHIWTFSATGTGRTMQRCDSCNIDRPSFVETSHYSCTSNERCNTNTNIVCAGLLWNGTQCTGNATFYRQLPQPTSADIEMRVCRDESKLNEDILLTVVEIYVQ